VILVIAEAALECVPEQIKNHPSVINRAKKLGCKPSETLLDRSYHHAAMKQIPENWKRGRPDIVHFALMEALSTPLFIQGHLDVYVHTYGNKIISMAENLRLPKSYFRFEGLVQSLFRDGDVKSSEGTALLEISDGTLGGLISYLKPSRVVGLSSAGVQSSAEQVVRASIDSLLHSGNNDDDDNRNNDDDGKGKKSIMFVVGGFPKGHFGDDTTALFNCTYSIEGMGLEAHVVVARILYECEKQAKEEEEKKKDERSGISSIRGAAEG
jgi:rRNA small subunit pseudouridine methyltransferase Nep1